MKRRNAIQNTGWVTAAALLSPTLLPMLQSCQSESRLDWQPQGLAQADAACISALVDMILPRTETPGALDVNVDIFIDRVVANTFDKAGQENMNASIAAFNDICIQQFGNAFVDLDLEEKKSILIAEENKGGKFSGAVWGTAVGPQEEISFYRSIKAMAIGAYFSSEEIGKNVLNYDPIPQEYSGCISLNEIGNRWTL